MSTVNAPNPRLDSTVRVFDQFYKYDTQVPVNEYDAVYSYFMSVFKTKDAAANFTTALFRVADYTSTPVLTLLQSMQTQNLDAIQVSATLAYFLNGTRSPSTLLGVNSSLTPNFFTARNVVS
jgi:hypothetical protein